MGCRKAASLALEGSRRGHTGGTESGESGQDYPPVARSLACPAG